jgi:hypothetical protein
MRRPKKEVIEAGRIILLDKPLGKKRLLETIEQDMERESIV